MSLHYYNTNEFRSGLKIIVDSEPCIIIENEFIKPGKGQSFNRVRLKKLISKKVLEKIFKSGDSVPAADVVEINLTYLYRDREFWYFINKKTYEQLAVNNKAIGDNAKWMVEQTICTLTLWNGEPIIVNPPNFVELEIINTDLNLKGDTLGGSSNKLAILKTGAVVKVPLFLRTGETVKIDTRSGEYVSRIKQL
ncbi:elongation factor P [Sodalis sp. CWE]|uniref:elongation factor P n=1 Tax=Sodalis sp. CWE TaxID=2803816 RepID=UPI001C7CE0D0|nr:elongation factor P [Sodalis sp. CWE]MBX4180815.1 elongation factor P [Sodalis sp. CWE]